MTLFFTMLPIYLFGNLHCLGMCGPLVMMIGNHRYRYFYFLGRTLSFTLAGGIAGEIGSVLNLVLREYHISALTSFIFGGLILVIGVFSLFGLSYPGSRWLGRQLSGINKSLSLLMLRDKPFASFLFGFFTLALPCGQTLVVFSACALAGDFFIGLFNGLMFALLTSPALLMAMRAHRLLHRAKAYYNTLMGLAAIFVGFLAICRGMAEMDLISHWVLNPEHSANFHVVIF